MSSIKTDLVLTPKAAKKAVKPIATAVSDVQPAIVKGAPASLAPPEDMMVWSIQAACIAGLLANPQFNNSDAVQIGLAIEKELHEKLFSIAEVSNQAILILDSSISFIAFGVLANPQIQIPNAVELIIAAVLEATKAVNSHS